MYIYKLTVCIWVYLCFRNTQVVSSQEPACQCWRQVQSLSWKDPLEEEMATHSSILAWENPMDRGAWWAIVCGVTKNWT